MYISSDIAKRIKLIAKEKNISVKTMLEDVGLGFNTMSNMKTSMPKCDNLAKIADYLDVSVDYLLGRTDVKELIKVTENNLSESERTLLCKFRDADEEHRFEIISAVINILNNSDSK